MLQACRVIFFHTLFYTLFDMLRIIKSYTIIHPPLIYVNLILKSMLINCDNKGFKRTSVSGPR